MNDNGVHRGQRGASTPGVRRYVQMRWMRRRWRSISIAREGTMAVLSRRQAVHVDLDCEQILFSNFRSSVAADY
ncbi:hypothetical protein ACSMXN_21930 [Jatrophihabitans sp. DSM 45814]